MTKDELLKARADIDAQLVEIDAKEEETKRAARLPVPMEKPNFTALTAFVKKEIEFLNTDGCGHKEFDHHAAELALEAVYGSDIFAWIEETENEL